MIWRNAKRFSFVTLGARPWMLLVVSSTATYPEECWQWCSTLTIPHSQLIMFLCMVFAKVGLVPELKLFIQNSVGTEDDQTTLVNLLLLGSGFVTYALCSIHHIPVKWYSFGWQIVRFQNLFLWISCENRGRYFRPCPGSWTFLNRGCYLKQSR